MSRLQELLAQIRELEKRVTDEIGREAVEFGYTIQTKRVLFEKEIIQKHLAMAKRIRTYLAECSLLGLLVAPVVYSLIIPMVVFDLFIWGYQVICFPVYQIPKVKRTDYIAVDRHKLRYLNYIERINCVYCGYANGFIAYAQEVAARSEQYWCPIKHARKLNANHQRYDRFVSYGDADAYLQQSKRLRAEVQGKQLQ